MRQAVAGKYIWVSVDETVDSQNRNIANCVFGIHCDGEEQIQTYLLNIAVVDKCNSSTMAAFFTDSLMLLYPGGMCNLFAIHLLRYSTVNVYSHNLTVSFSMNIAGMKYDKMLLIVTDAAPYMKAMVRGISVLFPKMLHITCLAHGLQRVAEVIRSKFPVVNSLISSTKIVFLNSPITC